MNSFYTEQELQGIGFRSVGKSVFVSRKSSIYCPENIVIGSNVRIDDFSLLSASGEITIGSYVHISAYCALYGGSSITLKDYSGLSPRATLFSETDDFSGASLINPFIPEKYKPGYISAPIVLESYTQVGSGCVVMPGVTLQEGSVLGANSFAKVDLESWSINAGNPARKIKDRNKAILNLKKNFLQES